MTNPQNPPSRPPQNQQKQTAQAARLAAKRAENLRQNLMKRKEQVRARSASEQDPSSSN